MRFVIMTWAGEAARAESIFGLTDETGSGKLPALSAHGYWADFRILDEAQFKFAAEAKASIGKDGYYLIGAGVTTTEAFGMEAGKFEIDGDDNTEQSRREL